jgi:hypothetical protein
MAVYYGVVKDGVVVLPEETQLEEGTIVEIHPTPPLSPEEQVKQDLLRAGVLSRIARPPPYRADEDRTLIVVFGEPLSEQIIRERR